MLRDSVTGQLLSCSDPQSVLVQLLPGTNIVPVFFMNKWWMTLPQSVIPSTIIFKIEYRDLIGNQFIITFTVLSLRLQETHMFSILLPVSLCVFVIYIRFSVKSPTISLLSRKR